MDASQSSANIPDWTIVDPLLSNVIPPSVASTDRSFSVEITGEAFWIWRDLKTDPQNYYKALNASLKPLGYQISDNAEVTTRIGTRISVETRYLHSKVSEEKNPKRRKAIPGSFLRKITIEESSIIQLPSQDIQHLKKQISELEQKLDEQASEVFELLKDAMRQKNEMKKLEEATKGLKNPGKPVHEVGERQRYRQLNTIR